MRSLTGTTILSAVEDGNGYVMEGTVESIGSGLPTTASTFAVGCKIIDKSTAKQYVNRGTVAVPAWRQEGQFLMTCTPTNGTTPVNIFDANGAPCAMTIVGVFVVSRDTTAGNITPKQGANTVCTIAKGTSTGVAVGGATLSNTVYAKGDVATVVSSSAGNADVFISWTF